MLKIPLPGGSGVAKSGAIQFENDWPGLFLRGDTAIVVSLATPPATPPPRAVFCPDLSPVPD